jgi:transposase-like protein
MRPLAIRAAAVEAYVQEPRTSVADIARRYGVSFRTISRWARAAGVERRIDIKLPIRHGTVHAYCRRGCRCIDCRAAHATRQRALRASNRARVA